MTYLDPKQHAELRKKVFAVMQARQWTLDMICEEFSQNADEEMVERLINEAMHEWFKSQEEEQQWAENCCGTA
jgi:hypothetical protein